MVGAQFAAVAGQDSFGPLPLGGADRAGEFGQEAGDDPDVLDVEVAGAPGGGGRRLARRQGLPRQAGARGQWLGQGRPASGLGGSDPQPVGQHLVRGPAQGADLAAADLDGDVTAEHGLAAGQGLAASGQPDQIVGTERGQVHPGQHIEGVVDLLDRPGYRTRKHVRILCRWTDTITPTTSNLGQNPRCG